MKLADFEIHMKELHGKHVPTIVLDKPGVVKSQKHVSDKFQMLKE